MLDLLGFMRSKIYAKNTGFDVVRQYFNLQKKDQGFCKAI